MNLPDSVFAGANTILDVGGWFKPEPRATHVVDLMPWETRGAKLSPVPQPEERFTKSTWFQADFLRPDFKLPFADQSFDLAVCGHTIEDLADPERLLGELQRVARRGAIECPSRLTEQTLGMRNREAAAAGHPHHHWIVDVENGELCLYSKPDSGLSRDATTVPLVFTEAQTNKDPLRNFVFFQWSGSFRHRFIHGDACRQRAREFVAALNIPPVLRTKDRLLRLARRLRSYSRGRFTEDFSWWPKIVEASRPYSTIELK